MKKMVSITSVLSNMKNGAQRGTAEIAATAELVIEGSRFAANCAALSGNSDARNSLIIQSAQNIARTIDKAFEPSASCISDALRNGNASFKDILNNPFKLEGPSRVAAKKLWATTILGECGVSEALTSTAPEITRLIPEMAALISNILKGPKPSDASSSFLVGGVSPSAPNQNPGDLYHYESGKVDCQSDDFQACAKGMSVGVLRVLTTKDFNPQESFSVSSFSFSSLCSDVAAVYWSHTGYTEEDIRLTLRLQTIGEAHGVDSSCISIDHVVSDKQRVIVRLAATISKIHSELDKNT